MKVETPTVRRIVHNAQMAAFEKTFIDHRQTKDLFQAIDKLRRRFNPEVANDLQGHVVFVIGQSGAGKSEALKTYHARSLAEPEAFRSTPDGDMMAVVLLDDVHPNGSRDLAVGMLRKLGYPAPPPRVPLYEIGDQLAHLCRKMGVQVVLVDEAHHLVRGKGDNAIQKTREFLKELLNQSGAQFVLAGVPELLRMRETTDADIWDPKQIERRRADTIELGAYRWGELESRSRFLNLLEGMANASGLKFTVPLDGSFLAPRMYLVSEGQIGIVSKYLSDLIDLAMTEDLTMVTPKDLGRIWWRFNRPTGSLDIPLDFDAVPENETEARSVDGNPFTSDDEAFRVIWRRWALDGCKEDKAADKDKTADKDKAADKDSTADEDSTDAGNGTKQATNAPKPRLSKIILSQGAGTGRTRPFAKTGVLGL